MGRVRADRRCCPGRHPVQYLPQSALRKLNSCAAALLMGCSSGRLRHCGDYEATGVVLAYLIAGAVPPLRAVPAAATHPLRRCISPAAIACTVLTRQLPCSELLVI